jgi:RNA polymerase sigma-70 factor, ECF subfamily
VANAATEMVLRTPGPARDGTLPRGRPPSRAAPVTPIGVRPCRASTPDRVKFARPSTPIPHPGASDPSAPDLSTGQDQAVAPDQVGGQHQAAETSATEPAGSEVDTAAWELVAAAQQGDQNAFGQLYDRYVDVVFRFVLFRVGDRPLAEDLTSETFLRALRRISSVSYQGRDVGAWFVTIARNLVLDHVKSSRYRLEMTTADILDSSADDRGPEHEVVEEATATELMRCVAQLGRDQQECIMLRFMQGLSVSETAAMMGRNEGAVKALQHRAVRRLAQLLPEGLR